MSGKHSRLFMAAGIGVVLLAASGCRTLPTKMVIESYNGGMPRKGSYMDYWLNIREVPKADESGPVKRVLIRAENKHMDERNPHRDLKRLDFEYRFLWFDEQSFPVESLVSTWTKCTLQKGDVIEFVGIAPRKEATQYRFEIRYVSTDYR
jgi:uncharacterized protein YcfL